MRSTLTARRHAGLPQTRCPEAGFASIAYRWGRGAGLDDLFGEEGGGVGDFVRNCRQLIDLLRAEGQILLTVELEIDTLML